jgi:hypothetical protein
MAVAQTIFLWLCCHHLHLHVWLARQTLRQQQHEAALARLQYKQNCCLCVALAEKQRQQAAAAQAKALADEATKQCCHKVATWEKALANKVNKQQRKEWAERAAALAESVSTAEQRCSLFAVPLKTATNLAVEKQLAELAEFAASWAVMSAEWAAANKANKQSCLKTAGRKKALADDAKAQHCQESAAHAAVLVELVLAAERSCQELGDRAAVSAEATLEDEHCCQKVAKCSPTMGETALAEERRCSLLVAQTAESALAAAQVVVSADLALPKLALPKDKQRQEDAATDQYWADD